MQQGPAALQQTPLQQAANFVPQISAQPNPQQAAGFVPMAAFAQNVPTFPPLIAIPGAGVPTHISADFTHKGKCLSLGYSAMR